MNKRVIAAAGAAVAALVVGGVVGVQALTSGACGSSICIGDSWQSAYAAAAPGAVLTVQSGNHPSQLMNYVAAKESATQRVIIEADGASMPAMELKGTQHLEVRDLTLTGQSLTVRLSTGTSLSSTAKPAKDLVFPGLDAKTFLIRNAQGVTIRDAQVGGFNQSIQNYGVPKTGSYSPQAGVQPMPARNILLERIFFHDIIRTIVGSSHVECLFVEVGSEQVTVRDSTFTNCGVFDIFVEPRGTLVKDLVIEGNLMDVPRDTDGSAVMTPISLKGGPFLNVTIRNNHILGNVRTDSAAPNWPASGTLIFSGNQWKNTVCNTWPASAFSGNTQSVGCGGTGNTIATPAFVSASLASCNLANCYRNDLRLQGSPPPPPTEPPPTTTEPPPTTTEPPPTTTEPPPTTTAPPSDSLPLTITATTATMVTVSWAPTGTGGYYFLRNGVVVSSTRNKSQTSIQFTRKAGDKLGVQAVNLGVSGSVSSP